MNLLFIQFQVVDTNYGRVPEECGGWFDTINATNMKIMQIFLFILSNLILLLKWVWSTTVNWWVLAKFLKHHSTILLQLKSDGSIVFSYLLTAQMFYIRMSMLFALISISTNDKKLTLSSQSSCKNNFWIK